MEVLDLIHKEEGWDIIQVHIIQGTGWERKGKKVKALQHNNGGEYVSNEFKNICAKEGILWESTITYNP